MFVSSFCEFYQIAEVFRALLSPSATGMAVFNTSAIAKGTLRLDSA
jgi:hypothetical protein